MLLEIRDWIRAVLNICDIRVAQRLHDPDIPVQPVAERAMSENPLYRHGGRFHPEQPWFVLNAAQHYSVIASENPAISHFTALMSRNRQA